MLLLKAAASWHFYWRIQQIIKVCFIWEHFWCVNQFWYRIFSTVTFYLHLSLFIGLGFNIIGGTDYQPNCKDSAIYVSKIKVDGPAALDGRLKEQDQILAVRHLSCLIWILSMKLTLDMPDSPALACSQILFPGAILANLSGIFPCFLMYCNQSTLQYFCHGLAFSIPLFPKPKIPQALLILLKYVQPTSNVYPFEALVIAHSLELWHFPL